MFEQENIISKGSESLISTHQVLRRTYMLLACTVLVSGLTAMIPLTVPGAPVPGIFASLIFWFGSLFAVMMMRRSIWALVPLFIFTGFGGYFLGFVFQSYLQMFSNGAQLITTALGSTGIIFFALSAYVLTTRKDFSFMGGMLFVALIGAILLSLVGVFFPMPMLNLVISAAMILIFSGFILYDTSRIIHGGERNFIMATVSLYLDLFNLLINVLHILGALAGQRD